MSGKSRCDASPERPVATRCRPILGRRSPQTVDESPPNSPVNTMQSQLSDLNLTLDKNVLTQPSCHVSPHVFVAPSSETVLDPWNEILLDIGTSIDEDILQESKVLLRDSASFRERGSYVAIPDGIMESLKCGHSLLKAISERQPDKVQFLHLLRDLFMIHEELKKQINEIIQDLDKKACWAKCARTDDASSLTDVRPIRRIDKLFWTPITSQKKLSLHHSDGGVIFHKRERSSWDSVLIPKVLWEEMVQREVDIARRVNQSVNSLVCPLHILGNTFLYVDYFTPNSKVRVKLVHLRKFRATGGMEPTDIGLAVTPPRWEIIMDYLRKAPERHAWVTRNDPTLTVVKGFIDGDSDD